MTSINEGRCVARSGLIVLTNTSASCPASKTVAPVLTRSRLCCLCVATARRSGVGRTCPWWSAGTSVTRPGSMDTSACSKILLSCVDTSICGIGIDPANFCMAQSKVNLSCGHSKTVFCYQTSRTHECNTRCLSKLECDHPCPGTCHSCSGARLHSPCSQVCGRLLVFGHVCRERCGLPCLCQAQCQTRCGLCACTRVSFVYLKPL